MDIAGQIAVVTGGASGIGAACAAKLTENGATVVSWDLADGADYECDVSSEASVDDAMARTLAQVGTPTILVTSAGIRAPAASIQDTSLDTWERTFAVNTRGTFLSIRAVSRALIRAELGGSIAAIASIQGQVADQGMVTYSATKAAVFQMVRVAAQDLGPHGIRVNAIGPGPTDTPMVAFRLNDEYRQLVAENTPLGRYGSSELVADATVNIVKSDWITGQSIMVDGGSSLMSAMGPVRASRNRALAAAQEAGDS